MPSDELDPKIITKRNRTFLTVLFIIIILLFIAIVYLLTARPAIAPTGLVPATPQPTPSPSTAQDDISPWETYNNENLKFQFKYPQSWKLQEEFSKDYFEQAGVYWYTISTDNPDINGAVSINNPGFGGPSLVNEKASDIQIAGIQAKYIVGDPDPLMFGAGYKARILITAFTKDRNEYYIQFNLLKNYDEQEYLVKQLLSTFKFTD